MSMSTADAAHDVAPFPPELAERPLLDEADTADLTRLFGLLANDTRLKMLHVLVRDQEAAVGAIADQVQASTQTVSNHLQRMADQRIVATRRDGNRVLYRLIDPCVGGLMELGLCLLGNEPPCQPEN